MVSAQPLPLLGGAGRFARGYILSLSLGRGLFCSLDLCSSGSLGGSLSLPFSPDGNTQTVFVSRQPTKAALISGFDTA